MPVDQHSVKGVSKGHHNVHGIPESRRIWPPPKMRGQMAEFTELICVAFLD